MTGMTLKQFGRQEFIAACEAYRTALETGVNIVAASLVVHRTSGNPGVPVRWRSLPGKIFRETKRKA